jgi:hypothetical protein
MDTVRSWLDANEVRRLAEGLMEPSHEKEISESDAGYDEKFEGYTHRTVPSESDSVASPRASVTNALAAARKVAEGSGMLQASSGGIDPEQEDKKQAQPLDLSELDQAVILSHSKKWAEQFGLSSLILMGADQEVVFDTLENRMLTKMARKLAKSTPESGNLFVKVGAEACLQVVEISTAYGSLSLGSLVVAPLSGDRLVQLTAKVNQDLT